MNKDVYSFHDLAEWPSTGGAEAPPIRLAVIGDPVAHSLSPQLHGAALQTCGIGVSYGRLHIRPEELERAVPAIRDAGFLGFNVTIPHKSAIVPLVGRIEDHARRIGAVNTVVCDENGLSAFNTDGPGFVRAIRSEFSVDLRDLRILVLGAGGGAGRAVAVQCATEGCERLVLVNRTLEKAVRLAGELGPLFKTERLAGPAARLEAIPWDERLIRRQLDHIDLVVNATDIGMRATDAPALPESVMLPHLMVYDTVYTARRTRLMQAAEAAGARAANGLSMLLHQGVLAFEIWFDRPAPMPEMRAALEKAAYG